MSFEADFKSHLQVAALSSFVGDRIYPEIVPEGAAMPAITYSVFSSQPQNSLDGFTSGVSRMSVQIDCWATTRTAVNALALVVRNRMGVDAASFKSLVTAWPLVDDYEEDTKRHRRSLECACWYTE